MDNLQRERQFETDLCDYLGTHGWMYCGDTSDADRYDRERALFPEDVLAWVRQTQPEAWAALERDHAEAAGDHLLNRLRAALHQRGTLDVLRHGIDLPPWREALILAQFRPTLALNPQAMEHFQANRLRVVRQVRYSLQSESPLDLVLFLNGIPIATAELKTDFTHSIGDAVDAYRFDRDPHPAGAVSEPLLGFPGGAPVHFAVGHSSVRVATRLEGAATRFLPFNRGDDGGAGNAPNPHGHRTAYLWEEIWERESWLEILGRYLVVQRDSRKQLSGVLFPRYHQLDVTRRLTRAVLEEGVGGRYLIQHAAGADKAHTLAWIVHNLADLHDRAFWKVFDTVLVVSNRGGMERLLRDVHPDNTRLRGGPAQLAAVQTPEACAAQLMEGAKVLICPLEALPAALDTVRELVVSEQRRFAVVVDEGYAPQTSQTLARLLQVLSTEDLHELADGGEMSAEEILAAQTTVWPAPDTNVSCIVFSATPKTRTLERLGRRPDPTHAPVAFHVYSVRQAVEEGYLVDPLQNYTPYRLAFKLAHHGLEMEDAEVEKGGTYRGEVRWVKLHPYNVAQRVSLVVEHFRKHVAPLLEGRAKALVTVASRREAVRWKLAMERYLQDHGYPIGVLVAFAGEVNDPASGSSPFTETADVMNPLLRGRDVREAFATDAFQILIVANKHRAGIDQPLLCGLYIDRRLTGGSAVQTLCRLGRPYPGKDTTFVLDFVNDPTEALREFRSHHGPLNLERLSDPAQLFVLAERMDAAGHYDLAEVEGVAAAELNPRVRSGERVAAIEPVAQRLLRRFREAREQIEALLLFKADMAAFLRLYQFFSQVFDYGGSEYDKRFLFYRQLLPLLEFGREREGIDLSRAVRVRYSLASQSVPGLRMGAAPTGPGNGLAYDKRSVGTTDDLFEGDLTEDDQLVYVQHVLRRKLLESPVLAHEARACSRDEFVHSPELMREVVSAVMDVLSAHTNMGHQALGSEALRANLLDLLLGPGRLYETLRAQSEG